MNINDVKVKMEKEIKEVEVLKEKRTKIDQKIKDKNDKILNYKNQILKYEIEQATKTLTEKGTSLKEVMNAISKGDLTEIQAKIKENRI